MDTITSIFSLITSCISSLVTQLTLLLSEITKYTTMFKDMNYGTDNTITLIIDCINAFRFVVGNYLFTILITTILFGISFAIFKFIMKLKKLIMGDSNVLGNIGIFGKLLNFFKK